jgi:hypothetical protein
VCAADAVPCSAGAGISESLTPKQVRLLGNRAEEEARRLEIGPQSGVERAASVSRIGEVSESRSDAVMQCRCLPPSFFSFLGGISCMRAGLDMLVDATFPKIPPAETEITFHMKKTA